MSKLSEYSKFDHLDSDIDDDEDDLKETEVTSCLQPQHVPGSIGPQQQEQEKRQQPEEPSMLPTTSSTVLPQQQQQQQDSSGGDGNSGNGGDSDSPEPLFVFRRHGSQKLTTNRWVLQHAKTGQSIYEWEQTLQDVTIYIPTPPNVIAHVSQLICNILPNRLQVGQRKQQDQQEDHYFMNESTYATVDVANSTWTWDEETGILTIELQKANKGIVWETACLGDDEDDDDDDDDNNKNKTNKGNSTTKAVRLNPFQLEEEKEHLMLERWQEENPGMDFRGAKFNGSVPDPRSFMGGVKYE